MADHVLDLLGPLLLQQLLLSLQGEDYSSDSTVIYALLILTTQLAGGHLDVLDLWYSRRCYERSRGEMITMLYEKTLTRKYRNSAPEQENNPVFLETTQDTDSRKPTWALLRRIRLFSGIPQRPKQATKAGTKEKAADMGKILNLMR